MKYVVEHLLRVNLIGANLIGANLMRLTPRSPLRLAPERTSQFAERLPNFSSERPSETVQKPSTVPPPEDTTRHLLKSKAPKTAIN